VQRKQQHRSRLTDAECDDREPAGQPDDQNQLPPARFDQLPPLRPQQDRRPDHQHRDAVTGPPLQPKPWPRATAGSCNRGRADQATGQRTQAACPAMNLSSPDLVVRSGRPAAEHDRGRGADQWFDTVSRGYDRRAGQRQLMLQIDADLGDDDRRDDRGPAAAVREQQGPSCLLCGRN
jgi:hypothetical protein